MKLSDEEIKEILSNNKKIAVIGCSSTSSKPAHEIPKFMQSQGYKIIPVNPNAERILGEKAYKSISEIKEEIDIVNIFRPSEEVLELIKKALPKHPKIIWMQLGIEDKEAEKLAEEQGVRIVMNKCIMLEFNRLMQ